MDSLTIIITASFIPTHPSIRIIQQTIESLKLINMPSDTKIILAHDYSKNPKYLEYLQNLTEYIKPYSNIVIVQRNSHGHLTGNIRNSLKYVNSKYILLVQHDFPFIRNFNIENVINDMEENPMIKHVRFNKRNNVKRRWDAQNNLFGLHVKQSNYTYTRTPAWSDNNHICLTSYYNNIIMKECPDGCAMEKKLKSQARGPKWHKKFGTYMFGEVNNPAVIKHTDGRRSKPIKE